MSDLDTKAFAAPPAPKTVGVQPFDSVALARLIDEVRNPGDDRVRNVAGYNRTYHRHNR
jgi:hypothetical protein